jgi:hypothetical protein
LLVFSSSNLLLVGECPLLTAGSTGSPSVPKRPFLKFDMSILLADNPWRVLSLIRPWFRKQKSQTMTKTLSLAAIAGLIVVASSTADARGGPGGGGGFGASAFSPGQQFRMNRSVNGYPGASGYAPGHLKRSLGPADGYPGASGYAPGRKFKHR